MIQNFLVVMVVTIVAFQAGSFYRKGCTANADDLIRAGFTVTDPEGYDIADFDDSFDLASCFN